MENLYHAICELNQCLKDEDEKNAIEQVKYKKKQLH